MMGRPVSYSPTYPREFDKVHRPAGPLTPRTAPTNWFTATPVQPDPVRPSFQKPDSKLDQLVFDPPTAVSPHRPGRPTFVINWSTLPAAPGPKAAPAAPISVTNWSTLPKISSAGCAGPGVRGRVGASWWWEVFGTRARHHHQVPPAPGGAPPRSEQLVEEDGRSYRFRGPIP